MIWTIYMTPFIALVNEKFVNKLKAWMIIFWRYIMIYGMHTREWGRLKKLGFDKYDKATYYGINIFRPMIIFQVRILRWLAAIPTTNKHQVNLYRLEYSMEKALEEADPSIAGNVLIFYQLFQVCRPPIFWTV